MRCEFDYCIYNKRFICILEEIQMNCIGMCDSCIIIAVSEEKLEEYKSNINTVGINRVESRHDSNNPNFGKVMMRCGMKHEGTMREADWNNQEICDSAMYAILADDYKAR